MSNLTHKSSTVARVLLGTIFFVFGLNGFLHFLPMPPMPEAAGVFIGGLASAGYFFPLLKGIEVLAAVLLLSNRFVPLALTLLAPITVNILLFHLVLAPAPGLPLVILAAQLFLAWVHRDAYSAVLRAKTELAAPSQRLGRAIESHA